MKIKELTNDNVAAYLKLDLFDEMEEHEQKLVELIKEAAFSYIEAETGLSAEEIEQKDDLTIAYLVLCQDMYDNRAMQLDKNTINQTVDTILSRHRVNLI